MRTVSTLPIGRLCFAALLAFVAVGVTLGNAQSDKPDFSGRWEIDKAHSSRPDISEEVIEHDDPKLVITTTPATGEKFAIRLSTDGKENLNIVGGREMTARTTWEGNKLVTVVRDSQGMQFTEVRALSEDGKVQTTQGFMDPARTRAMFKRVMVKKQ